MHNAGGVFYLTCSMKIFSSGLLMLFWCISGFAQPGTPARISSVQVFKESVQADPLKQMDDLKKTVPGILLDLRYATKSNFTGKKLYPWAKTTYMRTAAAKALLGIQQSLNRKGYGLKVFDAYRPWSATNKMWELVKDERYVANPAKGSNHNRGLAIDLTLVQWPSGSELDMGTGFDNFTDTAHHNFTRLSQNILNNRKLLKETMEQQGFKSFESEWWHYTWPDNRGYEVLDIPLKKLWAVNRQ